MKNARNRKRRKGTITRNSRSRLPSGFARSQTSVADLTLDYLFPLLYDSLLPLRYSPTLSGGFSLPRAEDSHSAEWLFIQTLPSSAILHGFINARNGKSKIQTLSPFFSLLYSLPLSASIDFNFSRVRVATPHKNPASIPVKFARTRLSIYSDSWITPSSFLPWTRSASIRQSLKVKSREFYFAAVLHIRVKLSG